MTNHKARKKLTNQKWTQIQDPCGISEQAFGSHFADGPYRGFYDTSGCSVCSVSFIIVDSKLQTGLKRPSLKCIKDKFRDGKINHLTAEIWRAWLFQWVPSQLRSRQCNHECCGREGQEKLRDQMLLFKARAAFDLAVFPTLPFRNTHYVS